MIVIDSKEHFYLQIYEHFKSKIRSGELLKNAKLPSKRQLANQLGVSINTVDTAYAQLVSEGYVESQERRGFFVCALESQRELKSDKELLSSEVSIPSEKKYIVDFSPTDIDLDHFPFALWRKLLRRCFDADDTNLLKRSPLQGNTSLREELRYYLYNSRGVNCRMEQIVIGAGTDALLDRLAEMFKNAAIAVENPLHSNAYRIFDAAGCSVLPIPLDSKGLDIRHLPMSGVQAVYVTPSHQFPMGISMPIGRRMELLNWAVTSNAYIIEDDYDSEFRYNSRPLPSLQGMDNYERVIYLGTFSKSVAPSLRVGYMVLPEHLLGMYNEHNRFLGSFVSTFEQLILAEFMSNGHFERHINRMRKIYRSKRDVILQELSAYTDVVEVLGEDAGQHILIEVKGTKTADCLVESAKQNQIKVYSLSNYYIGKLPALYEKHVLLGYGGLSSEKIVMGVRALMRSWQS